MNNIKVEEITTAPRGISRSGWPLRTHLFFRFSNQRKTLKIFHQSHKAAVLAP